MKIEQILKDIKGVFKPPTKKWYFGKVKHGCPYFYPHGWCSTIIRWRRLKLTPQNVLDTYVNDYVRKAHKFSNIPMVRRNKDWIFKLFGNYYWLEIGWPVIVKKNDLGWKDKWQSPRFEWSPSFHIFFFNLQLCYWWVAPKVATDRDNDKYWEQVIWFIKYQDKDINKAKKEWGWVDYDTKQSTWNDEYLIDNWKLYGSTE